MHDLLELLYALFRFTMFVVLGFIFLRIMIDDLEVRKTRFGWRAGWVGRVLGIHSQSGHLAAECWCQRR